MAAPFQGEGYKLFVGDLPSDISEEEIRMVFSTYGEVKNVHLMNASPATPYRCALVWYSTMQSAEDAIKVLNNVYKIRADAVNPIKVDWAKEKAPGGPMGMGMGGMGMGMGAPMGGPMMGGGMGGGSLAEKAHEQDGFKLFVGGLPLDIREDELRMVFQTYGQVNKIHILPAKDGAPRLAAFIFYEQAQSGDDAIAVLHDQYRIRVDAEYPIQVKWGQNRPFGAGPPPSGGGLGGADGPKMQTPDGLWKLFVGGLPLDCTEQELQMVFSTYGELRKVHVMTPHTSSGRVAAFVYYASDTAAEDAIVALNGVYKIREHAEAPIQVRWANDKKGGGKGAPGGFGAPAGFDGGAPWAQGGGYGGASGMPQPAWEGGAPAGGMDHGMGGFGGGKGGGGGGKGPPEGKLFVGNLPDGVNEEALRYVFSTYGTVVNVHVMTGKSKSGAACAFVEMADGMSAETASQTLNDKYEIQPGTGPIMVKKARSRANPY